jgi:glutamate--cysteine ligase
MNMVKHPLIMEKIIERLKDKQEDVYRWLDSLENTKELPIYTSVDIRDAGFKTAVVDTNLFPAGFNNICEHGLEDSVKYIREAILSRVPSCKNILIVAEEHTRNTWYLENVRILEQIVHRAGFDVKIATFLTMQPEFCEKMHFVQLETATGQPVKIHCFKRILSELEVGREKFDMVIMNNDLTTGIPDVLKKTQVPIYPSIQAGWHARLKSHHFAFMSDLIDEFAKILEWDSWYFKCLFTVEDQVNINVEADRKRLTLAAEKLLEDIKKKYKEHGILEKPYLIMKADAGTYGMGVIPIEDPQDIMTLNRKERNNLSKGKSAHIIDRLLIQEGVPTIYHTDHDVSEVCIYQIENNLVGGFYRTHAQKTVRENLNAQGVTFQKMCPHLKKYGDCGTHHDLNIFDVYRILARIAGIAAHREIVKLEASAK